MIARTMAVFLMTASAAVAADRGDIDFAAAASLPPGIWDALSKISGHAVITAINPFYLQGDFDGDGWRDTAVLVRETSSGKVGAAVVFKGGKIRILGAGNDVGDGTSDLNWMDAWYVEPKGKVSQGATDAPPPKLRGDALMAIKTESGSGLIYWDGKAFRFYQQGD